MKKSCVIRDSNVSLQIDPPNLSIPRCSSTQQFFSLNTVKKRKPNTGLAYSLTIQPSAQKVQFKHSRKDSEGNLSWKPNSEAITDTTISDKGIFFKNSKQKRKINHISIEKHLEEKTVPTILPKIKQLTWNQHQKDASFCSHRRSRKMHTKNSEQTFSMADFKVISKIGEGNYSEVFSAYERKSGFLCAIKKLKKSYLWQNGLVDVIVRQIKIHFYLKHSNIVDLYGWFDDKEYVYLICQYCCNGDLYKFLKKKTNNCEEIGVFECSYLLSQVCQALSGMHENKIMHRDIKPENIFLTIGNVAKLGDLGWSVSYQSQNLRETHCGTPLYLAPELLVEKCEYTHSVDIWSLGVLSYQLLTGDIPFKIIQMEDMNKIISQDIDFDCFDDQIARNFVEKLLQKDTTKRVSINEIMEHPFLRIHEEHYF